MKKLLMFAMLLSACGDDTKPEPLTCPEVGCTEDALCNRKGDCVCQLGSDEPVACVRAAIGSAQ